VQTNVFNSRQPAVGRTLVLIFGVAVLGGCASSHVAVDSAWQEGVSQKPFTKVLVVGVTPDAKQRCRFERALASRVRSASTQAIPSCEVVADKTQLTRESIEQAVAAQKIDAVLATSLISQEWGTTQGGRESRGDAYYKATDVGYATGYYGVYGVPVVYGEFQTAESLTLLKGTVRVTSKMFETSGPSVVYTMDTEISGFESREGLSALTTAIADRLRRDGLAR
jgi:hypothetical protein